MKLTRNLVLSLACVGGAFACGLVANAAIDLVMPMPTPVPARVAVEVVPAAQPAEAPAPVATAYALASTTSTPVDISPVKVKTFPVVMREEPVAAPVAAVRTAAIPLPRPRPASAPGGENTASIARQPAAQAISAATKVAPDDADMLSAAQIDRMKTALALTAEQEEFWPAIAVELTAIGRQLPRKSAANGYAPKLDVDYDTMQRLYWAAAPLITRLSHEQKAKAKQMARLMGLNEVAEAL